MPVPAGYTLDQSTSNLPAGYTLDKPSAPKADEEGYASQLFHSLAAHMGATPEVAKASFDDFQQHPVQRFLEDASGITALKQMYDQVKSAPAAIAKTAKGSASEIKQAASDAMSGNAAGAIVHTVNAVPIVGPAINRSAMATAPSTGHYLSDVANVVKNPQIMGDVGAAAFQAAPVVAGLVEKVPLGDAALAKVAAPVQSAADAAATATKRVSGAVGSAARSAATATGAAAEDAGIGLMNKTVGTLKSDFKRGANPARGYFDTGNGVSTSMRSIADKASDSLDATGAALGDAYKGATAKGIMIPFDTVAEQMAKPLQKALDLETGPGGTGNTATIKSYIDQFEPAFAKAQAQGGFTPSELFQIKRQIAENTNWSDPTQFNLKTVRQQQTGALGGILADAVPETSDLNQNYQDLIKLKNRAEERANTGSRPLTAHIYKAGATMLGAAAGAADGHPLAGAIAGTVLDSVPFKTTLATGLVKGGRALQSFATPSDGAAVEGVAAGDQPSSIANTKNGNPDGTPPRLGNGSTSGPDKWAADGAERVASHISSDPSSGITKSDIGILHSTPQGRAILIKASDLTPGSPAMRNLVAKIKESIGGAQ